MRLLAKYIDRVRRSYVVYLVFSLLMVLTYFFSRDLFSALSLLYFVFVFIESLRRVIKWAMG